MKKKLNRRDFLKLAGTTAAAAAIPPPCGTSFSPTRAASPNQPNILIFVYDAFSAMHISSTATQGRPPQT